MIVLDTVNKSLEVVLGGAVTTNQLDFASWYGDLNAATLKPVMAANDGASNGATPVTLVAAPAAGFTRQIKSFSVFNNDTVNTTVTIQLNNNATIRELVSIVLAPNESLIFFEGNYGVSPSSTGDMLKSVYDPANIAEQLVGLTATQTLTNKTLTSPSLTSPNITSGGLSVAGTERISAAGAFTGTTGSFTGTVTFQNSSPFNISAAAPVTSIADSSGLSGYRIKVAPLAGGTSPAFRFQNKDNANLIRADEDGDVTIGIKDLSITSGDLILATAGKVVDLSAGGFVKHSATGSITAGTTQTQAGATALTTEQNYIGTCANINDGVKLPTAQSGLEIHIRNNGANAAQVWPNTSDSIDGGAANAVDTNTLAAGASRIYVALDGTNWYTDGNS